MLSQLAVSSPALRRAADALRTTADGLTTEFARTCLADRPTGPEWATNVALAAMVDRMDDCLRRSSGTVQDLADALRTAASRYDHCDDTAANRLRAPW